MMMNRIIALLLSMPFYIVAQNLPVFKGNSTQQEKEKSMVYNAFHKKYNVLISYEKNCYMADPSKKQFFVLANKDNNWIFFLWEVNLKSTKSEQKKIRKSTIRKMPLNGVSVDTLLTYWTAQNFWNFSNDSINCREKIENGEVLLKSISDGCTEIIEVTSKSDYYVLKVTNADDYQEFVYTTQRQQFINCREKFFQLSQKK